MMEAEAQEPIDVHQALKNVVMLLQGDPARYRLFGVYWWPIKSLLKRAGYGPEQLYMLGSYSDPETASMVPPEGLEATLRAAFTEYGFNARYPRAGGMVEGPDGEIVRIWDSDAGL